MAYASANPYQHFGMTAAQAPADERSTFIRKTYVHLLGAVLAFVGIEAALFSTGMAERLTELMVGRGQMGLLVVLGGFMLVSWIANSWARSSNNVALQYAGLGLYVGAEAILFAPMLYFAAYMSGQPDVIASAGIITGVIFVGLTAAVFMTGADFSWMRTGLIAAGFAALAIAICGALFGFNLGIWFTGAMIFLASAYILYDTSNVLHHYRIGQHVAASLALFASVALLFWYVLRLLMSLSSRD
ncbi:MAG TPA: Bax inhibitor-1 family protein [Lacipirellulaceae bacterium]|nr:Bax inhibitor-1 family protein [Lacipirellulaceae bacterium]